jgi:hypothetical protein
MPIINDPTKEKEQSSNLLEWLLPKLDMWERHRDENYRDKWNEYYRLWRGIWIAEDKNRSKERSRLIAPALQQAIEASVSEIEEATFGRGTWFDMVPLAGDPKGKEVVKFREQYKQDLEDEGAVSNLCEVVLMAALYGTGIGEILVEEKSYYKIISKPVPNTLATQREAMAIPYFCVKLNPVSPMQLLVDPASTTIDDGLGVAVQDMMPKHQVVSLIEDGTYNKVVLGSYAHINDSRSIGERESINENDDKTKIVRYYGKIPRIYLDEAENKRKTGNTPNDVGNEEEWKDPEWDLVEAMVIIANDSVVLKATENPYFMKDRPVIAFQWDKVPKRFWGRGVAEKGYNPQKALDAELRARIDALALISHPMVAMDATKMPRGSKFDVYPGASILTTGNPNEAIMPFNFGNLNTATFNQSGDMERMVQMATGAMDSASPIGQSPRNSTSGGMSQMNGAMIKRAKRNLLNFQNNFLLPFVEKAFVRYIQFDPRRYNTDEMKFTPVGTLGIMAREFEQQLFIQLLSVTPKDSPVLPIIIKGIVENSSISSREDLIEMIEEASKPNPEKQQLEMMAQKMEIEYKQAQANYLNGQLEGIKMKSQLDAIKLQAEHDPNRADPKMQLEAHKLILEDQMKHKELELKEKALDAETQLRLQELDIQAEQLRINDKKVILDAKADGVFLKGEIDPALDVRLTKQDVILEALTDKLTKPKVFKVERDEEGNMIGITSTLNEG